MGSHAIEREGVVVLDALRRLVRFLRLASSAAEESTGATAAQLFVLQALSSGPAASLSELAARTVTDPSSVSTVVARLVARGLVTRAPSEKDRRRAEIALTAKGRAALKKAPPLAQERILEAVAGLPSAERAALVRGLSSLVGALGADALPARMFFEDEPRRREPARARA